MARGPGPILAPHLQIAYADRPEGVRNLPEVERICPPPTRSRHHAYRTCVQGRSVRQLWLAQSGVKQAAAVCMIALRLPPSQRFLHSGTVSASTIRDGASFTSLNKAELLQKRESKR